MLTIPASMQELVGRTIHTISTSYDLTRIIFDTYASRDNPRTRYAYDVSGVVDEFYRLTNMTGYRVTEVSVAPDDWDGRGKLYIATEDVDTWGLIYFNYSATEEGRITEDAIQRVLEQLIDDGCACRIVEQSAEVGALALTDVDVGKNPPYKQDPDGKYYTVEEGEVNYHTLGFIAIDCEGECS